MILNQFVLFLIYVATGIIICLIFDFFRSLRKSMNTSNNLTLIEDILFWLIAGLFLIMIISKFSYGELRFYSFIGLVLGAVFYFYTLSKFTIKLNVFIMTFIKKVIEFIAKCIFKIFGKPIRFVTINIRTVKSRLSNTQTKLNKKQKKVFSKNKILSNKLKSKFSRKK